MIIPAQPGYEVRRGKRIACVVAWIVDRFGNREIVTDTGEKLSDFDSFTLRDPQGREFRSEGL